LDNINVRTNKTNKNIKIMNYLKIKLLEILLNNIYKYNKNECREKYMETVMDEVYSLIK